MLVTLMFVVGPDAVQSKTRDCMVKSRPGNRVA